MVFQTKQYLKQKKETSKQKISFLKYEQFYSPTEMEEDIWKILNGINKAIERSEHENDDDRLCLSLAKQLKSLEPQFKAMQNQRLQK